MLTLYVSIVNRLSRLLQSERGQSMTEYALILALIAIVVIAIMTTLGGTITSVFTQINDKLSTILTNNP